MAAPASSALASILGRYAIGEEIARGGLATVHLGLVLGEAGFSRAVAVKRLLPGFARDQEFVASFLDEAKLASRIRHPNVVPTLDVLAQDGELFIVMEYVHGESLAGLIRAAADRDETIPLAVVSAMLGDALQGLHAAHEAKDERGAKLDVIHRDVSPHNVIVGVDGVARVLDFGIAKAAGRAQVTREGQVKGKLGYLSPEQFRQNAERASDIYAAGVCLWEALTLRRLFEGDNESAVLARIMAGIVAPPSKHVPELPSALDAVALRALRREPGQRFATAREMAIALSAAVAPASASEVGAWVERLAAKGLARRSEGLAAIEAEGAQRRGERAAIVESPSAVGPSALDEASQEPLSSAPVITRPSLEAAAIAPRRRSAWLAWGGAGVTIATAALLASLAWGARVKEPADVGVAPVAAAPPPPAELFDSPAPLATIRASAAPDPIPAVSSAPQRAAVARPRPTAIGAPKTSCDPPYSVDADAIRHYKKGCLR
jgi:eukaryotic-like serine/threonine-protein kinase